MDYQKVISLITHALVGHRVNTASQDGGKKCVCGSDSRARQGLGKRPWTSFDEPWTSIDRHRAQVAFRAIESFLEDELQQAYESGHDDGYGAGWKLQQDPYQN